MFVEERKDFILKKLYEDKKVYVQSLSKEMSVTAETIRRDLRDLERNGFLSKVHGGAILAKKINGELPLDVRKNMFITSKKIIANKATKYISEGYTIYLDSSTTSFEIAQEFHKFKHLKVITNSLPIMESLSKMNNIQLISLGGNYCSKNKSFVGKAALDSIKKYLADICFVSSTGLSEHGMLTDSNEGEALVRQSILCNSENKFYILDDTKFFRTSTYVIGSISDLSGILSNSKFPNKLSKLIEFNQKIIIDD
ncbi:DeoR/GlpR family DNA-binding transcription regulator [Bacillus thuringiensis]|nr:DeoR/GlpR family DNA-binding transcription regulator [Bacillus thuringiensis]